MGVSILWNHDFTWCSFIQQTHLCFSKPHLTMDRKNVDIFFADLNPMRKWSIHLLLMKKVVLFSLTAVFFGCTLYVKFWFERLFYLCYSEQVYVKGCKISNYSFIHDFWAYFNPKCKLDSFCQTCSFDNFILRTIFTKFIYNI